MPSRKQRCERNTKLSSTAELKIPIDSMCICLVRPGTGPLFALGLLKAHLTAASHIFPFLHLVLPSLQTLVFFCNFPNNISSSVASFLSPLSSVLFSLHIKFLLDTHIFNEISAKIITQVELSSFIDGVSKAFVGESDLFVPHTLRWG